MVEKENQVNARKYTSYLVVQEALNTVIETQEYSKGYSIQVYLKDFSFVEKKNNQYIRNANGVFHSDPVRSDFPAYAVELKFRKPPFWESNVEGLRAGWLDGHTHLAYFVDNKLLWIVKNLMMHSYRSVQEIGAFVAIQNPQFLASGYMDFRKTKQEFDDTKVTGSTKPDLLPGESVDEIVLGCTGAKIRKVPCYKPDELIPMVKELIRLYYNLPLFMHPNREHFGNKDILDFWAPIGRQVIILQEAINDLENLRVDTEMGSEK